MGVTPGYSRVWLHGLIDAFCLPFLSTAMDAIVDVDPAPMMGDVLNGFPLAVNMRLEITLLSSILSKSNLE